MEQHEGLKNLYKQVISGKFGLERFSLLNSIMDHTLYHIDGDIIEIGLGETTIYTTELSKKYNRNVYHCDYSKSLIDNLIDTNGYFCKNSIIYRGKSNNFFNEVEIDSIAVAFIDGSHEYKDVKNDFNNTLKYLVKDGIVILHDSYPPTKEWIVPEKCGTVYKLRNEIEEDNRFDVFTFPFTAFNVGLTLVRKRQSREWEYK